MEKGNNTLVFIGYELWVWSTYIILPLIGLYPVYV